MRARTAFAVAGVVFVAAAWAGAQETGGAGGGVCHAYVDRMIGCVRESAGETALTPDMIREVREAAREACQAIAAAGPDAMRAMGQALAECRGIPCPQWAECFARKFADAFAPQPNPPPEPIVPRRNPSRRGGP